MSSIFPLAGVVPLLGLALVQQASEPTAAPPQSGHERMVARLAEIAAKAAVDDIYVGTGALAKAQQELAALGAERKPFKRWKLLRTIAIEELKLGRNREAVEHAEAAVALDPELESLIDAGQRELARLELAIASMRWGESQNCVARHTAESCLLPISGGGVHVDQAGSKRAIEVLERILARNPEQMTARWLLNLAYMTIGGYPDRVPEAWRVPPEAFRSDEPFPRFPEVAPELDLNAMTLAGASVIDDFDGDGTLEIVTSSWEPDGPLQMWKRLADGTWVERSREAGFAGLTGGLNALQADYDGDGDLDLLVLRGAWMMAGGRVPNSLLRNDGRGHFRDVTYEAGLADPALPTQAADWADFDLDGDLDLYVGNESTSAIEAPSQLFLNRGDGTFVDVAAEAGVLNQRFAKGVSWGDYDGDRFPDLYVSNLGQPNRLYRNRGDGTFADVAPELGVQRPIDSFPCWFFDYDNDGALDIFVGTFYRSVEPIVRSYLGLETGAEALTLYRGDGKGGFREVGTELGLRRATVVMGANYGDLDDDGWLDLYLSTGYPAYEGLMPNLLYRNRAGKSFADVTTAAGVGHLQKGHAVSFADVDGDGDTDLFVEMGGAFTGDAFGNALFRNPGFGHRWIEVRLVGARSNRFGVGARLRCIVETEGGRFTLYRTVRSGGSFGAGPLTQHLGLGRATKLLELEVVWPASGTKQLFRDVALDRRVVIVEGDSDLRAELPAELPQRAR